MRLSFDEEEEGKKGFLHIFRGFAFGNFFSVHSDGAIFGGVFFFFQIIPGSESFYVMYWLLFYRCTVVCVCVC